MAGSRLRLGRSGERSLRVLFGDGALAARSDADLIRGFLEAHGEAAEAAFEAIAARHGPMVLGVCRRVLGDEHAAEDAFQAVFLILARKARSVQVDDSLGGWLHGVATRVARRAKDDAAREVPGASAAHRSTDDPAVSALRAEVRQMVGQEVARLPRKYREAVALCHLDGLSHDRAAEALGLPVGTVRSRLSRARDLLRTRLTRRGLAPAAPAAWLHSPQAEAAVSQALLDSTVKLAAAGGTKAAVPPAVAALACVATGGLLWAKAAAVGAVACLVCGMGGGLFLTNQAGEPAKTPPAPPMTKRVRIVGDNVTVSDDGGTPDDPSDDVTIEADSLLHEFKVPRDKPTTDEVQAFGPGRLTQATDRSPDDRKDPAKSAPAPAVPLADQFQRIIKEYDDGRKRMDEEAMKAKTEFEQSKYYTKHWVDEAPFAKRLIDLATERPKDPASRDALIWVVDKPHRADNLEYGLQVWRAVNLLIERHADDLETARLGLESNNVQSRRRDALLEAIYAIAKGRKAKGFARQALARYLEAKADLIDLYSKNEWRPFSMPMFDADGKTVMKPLLLDNEEEGYRVHLRMLDSDAIRREAERLYEEVVADYADIPYITTHRRDLERRLKKTSTDPKERAEQEELKEYLRMKKVPTLGEVAAGRLDEMRNLTVGKPAPDFEGVGVDGKPVKLSDFRGKVVVMDFWFAACGPCLREIPEQRDLTETMKGRPFTFLGIVSDGRNDDARKVIDSEKIAWPNILAGGREIAERYHVEGYPTHIVIDAPGVIRSKKDHSSIELPAFLDPLLKEAEAAAK